SPFSSLPVLVVTLTRIAVLVLVVIYRLLKLAIQAPGFMLGVIEPHATAEDADVVNSCRLAPRIFEQLNEHLKVEHYQPPGSSTSSNSHISLCPTQSFESAWLPRSWHATVGFR